ncbi:hypothetical protein [Brevibacillus laterosporus]|uniref:hypothetical protein n=1 Tax=Brevibacillus laterosporus TaxID=1465 RepID=UPI00264CEE49|nr:hypothetical protein [Brevibacillus laterosporus]MDN9009731.1 hypothetical protein [Brevibacillus laterosporus]MDO0940270.1 hypothetical protein [Brevibacillus laterosporus]
MKKVYLFLLISILAITSISSWSPTKAEAVKASVAASKNDKLTKENITFISSLLENSAPDVLTDKVLTSKGDIPKLLWFDKLQTWTGDFISLSRSKRFIDGNSKEVIISNLKKYYTPSKAEEIFAFFFKKRDNGTYECVETEGFSSSMQGIVEGLKVTIQKKTSTNIIVLFEGIGYDSLNFKKVLKRTTKVQFNLVKNKNQYLIDDMIDLD